MKLSFCHLALSIIIIMPFLFSCSDGRGKSDGVVGLYAGAHAEPGYFNFDQVDSLLPFLDSIAETYGFFYHGSERDGDGFEKIRECIAGVERYRREEVHYYPVEAVRGALDVLGFSAAYCSNHAYEDFNMVFCEWFLKCVAYYAPDISCLVNMQTPDHRAGVLNFGSSYNDAPWWAYVIFRREKGFEVQCLGDDSKITSIFQLEDETSQRYYLCSNNESRHVFRQELYLAKDSDVVVHVAGSSVAPVNDSVDFDTYCIDIENMSWKYCKWGGVNGCKRISVSDKPALILELCGKESSFVY